MNRIKKHPILVPSDRREIKFKFEGRELTAREGEMLSSALIANGINIFSRHHKDDSPQGIYCANGQCAQCTVIADGIAVKSCVTEVKEGMNAGRLIGLPSTKLSDRKFDFQKIETIKTDVLVVGGGPAGLSAAQELACAGAKIIIVDDKHRLGGKLVLQTHKFFGSVEDCYAGARGIKIAEMLENDIKKFPAVDIYLNSSAVAVFSDGKVGVIKENGYVLIEPRALLIAAGAREKTLMFPGNTLPGVYGAGAFQTLVNRDLVKCSGRLFIVGGGNVGLIAAYHAVQAGIDVAGLAEALPQVGGYKVHADKIARLGIPIFTKHSIISAEGKEQVETVTIAEVDKNFKPIKGTYKQFKADTLLIAVGLNPCDELYKQAKSFGMGVYCAGDAQEIAEASAAIFSGKIEGRKIAGDLGFIKTEIPPQWREKLEVLKSKPGNTIERKIAEKLSGVFPVFHCRQEIPCNPCVSVCPKKSIRLETECLTSMPVFDGECISCLKCVEICPGLAVSVVDERKDPDYPFIWIAYEMGAETVKKGETVVSADGDGNEIGRAVIEEIREAKKSNTFLLKLKAEKKISRLIAGIKIFSWEKETPVKAEEIKQMPDDIIICRCERVSLGEIRKAIRAGVRDINQLKAVTRAGMGSCQSKTCESLIMSIFRGEGIKTEEITPNTQRPLVMEVSFKDLAGATAAVKKPSSADF